MRKLGLDPSDMKYIVVTHAHGDHYGGVDYLIPRYRSGVVMSEVDWQQVEGKLEFNSPHWGAPPQYDKARDLPREGRRQGDARRHDGDHQRHARPHPRHGHAGVRGKTGRPSTHKVLLWGGTAFNFGKDVPRLQSYIDATRNAWPRVAKEQGIDVMLSNHAGL